MAQESGKNRIIGIVIIIVALVAAFNIYSSSQAKLNALKGSISEELKKNQEIDRIIRLEGRLRSYKKLLALKDASAVMNEVNSIAKLAGVKIISVKPAGEMLNPDYAKYFFEVSLDAPDYNSLNRFVSALESSNSVYMVEDMSVTGKSEFKDGEGIKVNLRLASVAINKL